MRIFSEAFDLLQSRMAEMAADPAKGNTSILEVLFGGDYSSFRLQREHLRSVDEKPYEEAEAADPNKVHW